MPDPSAKDVPMHSLKLRLLPAATTVALIVAAVETLGAGLKWS